MAPRIPDDANIESMLSEAARAISAPPQVKSAIQDRVLEQLAASSSGDTSIGLLNSTEAAVRPVPDAVTEPAGVGGPGITPMRPLPGRRQVRTSLITLFKRKPVHWSATAAAAAVIVVMINLWPGLAGRAGDAGVAWAAVVQNMQAAGTMMGRSTDGSARYRFYLKDPGQSRTEKYDGPVAPQSAATESPSSLEISTNTGSERRWVVWYPGAKRAIRFRRVGCRQRSSAEATTFLLNLKKIGSDEVRQAGQERIDNIETVVFEAPLRTALAGIDETAPDDGTVRLWVSKTTRMPVRVETTWRPSPGGDVNRMVTDLEWNVPLADDLFQTPAFDNTWNVSDTCKICFANAVPKAGVKLSVGPEGRTPLITEADVERIDSGTETTASTPGTPTRRELDCQLTQTAAARMAEYAKGHIGASLAINLNGHHVNTIDIRKHEGSPGAYRAVTVDITPLNISLEQFAQDYLTVNRGAGGLSATPGSR